jgi:hypothetical protein
MALLVSSLSLTTIFGLPRSRNTAMAVLTGIRPQLPNPIESVMLPVLERIRGSLSRVSIRLRFRQIPQMSYC